MKRIIFGLTALFSVACSTTPTNTNSLAKLQNEKAVDGIYRHSFMFKEVDDKKLKIGAFTTPNQAVHYITPGVHKLDIEVTHHYSGADVVWASKFIIDATLEGGEVYRVNAFEEGWCINMKVVNSKGVVVAGPVVSPLYPYISYNHMQNSALMERVNQKTKNATCTKKLTKQSNG